MTLTRIKGLLGIAQRAGFLCSGSSQVLDQVAKSRGKKDKGLVLVAEDAVTGTGIDLIYTCLKAGITVVKVPVSMTDLGHAIGKNRRGYVMIKDSSIARRILELLEEMEVQPLDQNQGL